MVIVMEKYSSLIVQLGSSAAQSISYLDIWKRLKRPLNIMAIQTLKTET